MQETEFYRAVMEFYYECCRLQLSMQGLQKLKCASCGTMFMAETETTTCPSCSEQSHSHQEHGAGGGCGCGH
jgi:rubrerythrin